MQLIFLWIATMSYSNTMLPIIWWRTYFRQWRGSNSWSLGLLRTYKPSAVTAWLHCLPEIPQRNCRCLFKLLGNNMPLFLAWFSPVTFAAKMVSQLGSLWTFIASSWSSFVAFCPMLNFTLIAHIYALSILLVSQKLPVTFCQRGHTQVMGYSTCTSILPATSLVRISSQWIYPTTNQSTRAFVVIKIVAAPCFSSCSSSLAIVVSGTMW